MTKPKQPCYCEAYPFPHKPNSGACQCQPAADGTLVAAYFPSVDRGIVAADNAARARDMNSVGGWR